jgi:glutaryl-CoA dehydrogenase
MTNDFSQSLGTDFYQLEDRLTGEERALRDKVRAFTDAEIIPVINQYWEAAQFPFDLVPKLATLGISG